MMKSEFCEKYGCKDEELSMEDFNCIEVFYLMDFYDLDTTTFCERFKNVPLKSLIEIGHIVKEIADENRDMRNTIERTAKECDEIREKLLGLRDLLSRYKDEIIEREIKSRTTGIEVETQNEIDGLLTD